MNEIETGIFQTRASFNPATFKEEDRSVEVVWTTGERVLRQPFFGDPYYEELEVSDKSVRLHRLNTGAPVLDTHRRDGLGNVIGVVEKAWITNGQGKAIIRFSEREDVAPIVNDVKNGIIRNISVGYSVSKYQDVSEDNAKIKTYRAIDWTPAEISLVPVGADYRANIRSSLEDERNVTTIIEKEIPTMENIENKEVTREESTVDAVALIAQERARIADITKTVRSAGLGSELAEDLIGRGVSIEEARSVILDEVIKRQPKVTNTTTVEDSKEKMTRGIEQALMARAGMDKIDNANEFRGYSLVDVARAFVPGVHGDKMTIVGRALSTSDFPYLLANVANKSLQNGFETAPETWRIWTRTISVSDFKTMSINAVSEFSALDAISEGQEYKYGSLSEKREQFALGTYGKLFSITRQALVNDDLNALTTIPAGMGRAAARKIGDVVYGILTANAALADGYPLFYARTQTNLTTGVPSVASFDAAKNLMAVQKDVAGVATLNIRPAFVLCPVALEGTCNVIVNAQYDPDTSSKLMRPNMVQGLAKVVADPRLDAASTTVWYMAADPAVHDTVVVAFLDGNQTPVLEQQNGWSVDGVDYKVRIDCAAKAVDYRGLVKSSGS